MDYIDRQILENAPDCLKVISRYGAGYDRVDIEAAAKRGIAVTVTPGSNAEAVADLISARSDRAASAAVEQLEGGISKLVSRSYDILVQSAADIEATLDFDEEELIENLGNQVALQIRSAAESLQKLSDTWNEGRVLRDGALVVIAGSPNAGKSTLLNSLLEVDRAIVTEHPGTTRDTIEEEMVLSGIPVRLIDTAGLRDTDCQTERQGVDRALECIRKADLLLHVIDGSRELDQGELATLAHEDFSRSIVILNKSDIGLAADVRLLKQRTVVRCSLLNNPDISSIRDAIIDALGLQISIPSHAVVSERHHQCIRAALESLNECIQLLRDRRDDFNILASGLIRESLEHLGRITGRSHTEEILDQVFGKFCVGK